MRINRSARTRYFTVLGNEVLRDRRLSFTARGLLAYLLSLPDGAREDVRTLADKNPGLGRRGVSKALDELVEYGYYIRRTVRDDGSGQVRTETYVFDSPQADCAAPLPTPAGPGEAETGKAGAFPKGNKNPEEEPTHPVPATATAVPQAGRVEGGAPAETTPAPVSEATGRGAAMLSRLASIEPRLALSAADTLALAPLAARWLENGVSELEARSLLTAGLPAAVHSARALLMDRLVRKLPAPRTRRDAAAPATPLVECAECRDPLPRGQQTGICSVCAGAAAHVDEAAPVMETVADRVAALRSALHTRPTTATVRA
ncbi:helix-turn-helix domain-containing protein [Streptomyces mauvecolor]